MKAFIVAIIAAVALGVVAAAVLDSLGMSSARTFSTTSVRL